jgi:hypothetical protein
MLAANAVVGGVFRGVWLGVANGLTAWSPVFLVRGTIHKPVWVHLLPQMMVKVTAHLALHMVKTESNKSDARLGITWAACAPAWRSDSWRVQVCVDCTLSPFGRQAMRGTVARKTLVAGALIVRKWLVAPESRMANCLMMAAWTLIVLRRIEAARV